MRRLAMVVAVGMAASAGVAVAEDLPARADLVKPGKAGAAARESAMRVLRQALVARLKDAESARFRGEYLSWSDDDERPVLSLCGEVNAKNGYGGYTGFVRYVSTGTGMVTAAGEPGSAAIDAVWGTWCGRPA